MGSQRVQTWLSELDHHHQTGKQIKIQKFEVQFLLNTYLICTSAKGKNLAWNCHMLGLVCIYRYLDISILMWYFPTDPFS